MKYDVFISYARRDFDEVCKLVNMLKERIPSLTYWFDITGIDGGDEFDDKIITAIDNSSCVLFALSDNAINSQWAKNEIIYAKNTEKKVIPLLLKDAKLKGWFLFNFGRIDCIDATNSLQIDKLVSNLSKIKDKTISARKLQIKTEVVKNDHTYSLQTDTLYYADGKKQYEGEMLNGKYHGQGTFYYTDGSKYIGQFKEGMCHGHGTLYYADGSKYIGQFIEGMCHGHGTLYYVNGSKYVGQFIEGMCHGQGTLYYTDGSKYVGQFKEGMCHGHGTLYYEGGFWREVLYSKGEVSFLGELARD